MAQAEGSAAFNTFIKGFISDSSDINSDPNSAKEINNFILTRRGTLEKRLGLKEENTGAYLNFNADGDFFTKRMTTFDGKEFMVIYVETGALAYLKILSEDTKTIVFTLYISKNSHISVNDKYIIISNSFYDIKVVQYNDVTSSFSLEGFINVDVRDFEGLYEGSSFENRPLTLTDIHRYNLENQGWGKTVKEYDTNSIGIDYNHFFTNTSTYPSNADIVTLGVQGDPGDGGELQFRTSNITSTYIGNTRAPSGRKILSTSVEFPRRLDTGYIIPDQPSYPFGNTSTRVCSTFYAGRIFFGARDNIFFSQTIGEDTSKMGRCYQEADPTSSEISDLIDTDGGVIKLSGASGIFSIVPMNNMIIVFAKNGIWSISGQEGSLFKATEYFVSKVSTFTAISDKVIKNVGGSVIFLSASGIMMIGQSDVTLSAIVQNISEGTIQSYFNQLNRTFLSNASLEYLEQDNKLYILIDNTLLILDIALKAWYKLTVPSGALGLYSKSGIDITVSTSNVVSGTNNVISGAQNVVLSTDSTTYVTPQIFLIYTYKNGATYDYLVRADFSNSNFIDFEGITELEQAYTASVITPPLSMDNFDTKKRLKQVTSFFEKTETGYVENSEGGLEYVNPSQCSLQIGWDMPTNTSYLLDPRNKWSREYEVYRLSRYESKSLGDVPGEAIDTISTRTSIRGLGRTITFKFESSGGFDCRLLGWVANMNTTTRSK